METKAIKLQVDEQFKDRDTAIMELNGGEYDQVTTGLAREKAMREDKGLPDPGQVLKTANTSIQETGSSETPESTDTGTDDSQEETETDE